MAPNQPAAFSQNKNKLQKKARLFGLVQKQNRGRASGEPLNGNAEQPKLKPKPDYYSGSSVSRVKVYGSTLHSFVSRDFEHA